MPDTATAYATTAGLTDADLAQHKALCITADMLERAQVHRVDDQDARDCLALKGRSGDLSGLIFPYRDPITGHIVTRRLRRDHPEIENGKPKDKYLAAWGDRRHLYFAPGCASALQDVTVDLLLCEAEKSVLSITCAAASRGRSILAIGTGGCWGWKGVKGKATDASGATVDEKGALADFDRVAWTGRKATICFDANATTNSNVQLARNTLVAELTKRGANVRIVNLPTLPGVNGPDDFIGRVGADAFFALLDQSTSSSGPVLIVRKASDVPDEPLVKVFGGRLVCGSFGLIAGPGEGGKGMTLADLTARFTTGEPFPGESQTRPAANVLICVTEDSQGRVKSRLRTVGADLERVYFVEGPEVTRGGLVMPSPMMLEDDAGPLVRLAKEIEAKAFFLETVVEHFGDRSGHSRRSTNNEADVRAALAPFRAICASASLFGLGALHPRKSYDGGVDDSISGSAAFRNVPRGAHHIYRDPEDEAPNPVRLFFSSKTNYLSQRPATLRFRIVSWDLDLKTKCTCTVQNCGHEGRVIWEEEDGLVDNRDAEEIWLQIAERSKVRRDVSVEDAEKFLTDLLVNDVIDLIPKQIFKLAGDGGISKAAVNRAKERLKLISVKEGFPAAVVRWKKPEPVPF